MRYDNYIRSTTKEGKEKKAMRDYIRTHLQQAIVIPSLITFYYFEFSKDYVFPGERHNFWELLFLDKGEVEVHTDDHSFIMTQGSIVFHKPNEFHQYSARSGKAPNVLVITFDCDSPAMQIFYNRMVQLNDEEHNLLAMIVQEAKHAFHTPFVYPPSRRSDAPIGSEQLIRNYLEALLITILRRELDTTTSLSTLTMTTREKHNEAFTASVIRYLEEHLHRNLSLDDISQSFHIAKTTLSEQFKKQTGQTVREYFDTLKVNQAKQYIREETSTFTQIAANLGYSSVHYFSKSFKRATGMSPSEYAKSIQARSQPKTKGLPLAASKNGPLVQKYK